MDHALHAERAHKSTPGRHTGHDIQDIRTRFWIVLVCTIPVELYSPSVQQLLSFTPPGFRGSEYVPFALGTFIFFYGGAFFLKGAFREFREHRPGMMILVSLAITVAYGFSVAVTFGFPGEPLYWELSTLIAVMLLGHWIEMSAVGRASGALQDLAKLMPDEAERIVDDRMETIPVADLRAGDIALVRPGAKVPADGEVVSGESAMNLAMITGESRPVEKSPGSEVIAGTVNGEGSLRIRVTKVGEDTALAGIMRLVTEAQASGSKAQNLADRAAYWLTLIAISAGGVTFIAWIVRGPAEFAIGRMVTVLVTACPHALGLAIPLVIAISTAIAARNGLLVRDRMALEIARELDTVVFDKTGTLTKGKLGVVGIFAGPGMDEREALGLAASVERDSEHALGRAIVRSAERRGIEVPASRDFRALPGIGAEAEVGDRKLSVGSSRLLESRGVHPPPEIASLATTARLIGHTLVYLVHDNSVLAAIALADEVRPESMEAVEQLRAMGIRIAMMTGDGEHTARRVAEELGIEEYYAGVLPAEKAKRIRTMRHQGRRVAMVGDGVNDAPALVSADVGIAIGAGTDVAIESGGIILVKNDPRDVAKVIRLSRAGYRKMVQNLAWATGYNVVAIPLAAGVLAGYGIVLPPAVGALLMSISTVIVALNAQLLRRLSL